MFKYLSDKPSKRARSGTTQAGIRARLCGKFLCLLLPPLSLGPRPHRLPAARSDREPLHANAYAFVSGFAACSQQVMAQPRLNCRLIER